MTNEYVHGDAGDMIAWIEDEASRHQRDPSEPDLCVQCGVAFPCKFADTLLP